MIRIKRLRMVNFRRFPDATIAFGNEGILGIVGKNGSGKSTVLEGIGYALYGSQPILTRTGKEDMKRSDAPDSDQWGVELDFASGGVDYTITRMTRGMQARHKGFVELVSSGSVVAKDATAVTARIVELVGMDFQAFLASVYCRQSEVDALSSMQPAERKKMISRTLKMDGIDEAITDLRKDKRDVDTRIKAFEESMGSVDELLANKDILNDEFDAAKARLESANARKVDISDKLKSATESRTKILSARSKLDGEIKKMESDKVASERRWMLEPAIDELRGMIWSNDKMMAAVDSGAITTKDSVKKELESTISRQGILRHTVADLASRIDGVSGMGDECPTCNQSITSEYAARLKLGYVLQKNECETEAHDAELTIAHLRERLAYIDSEETKKRRNDELSRDTAVHNKVIAEKTAELEALKNVKFDGERYAAAVMELGKIDAAFHESDVSVNDFQSALRLANDELVAASSKAASLEARLKDLSRRIVEFSKSKDKVADYAKRVEKMAIADATMSDFRMYLIGRVRPMLASFTSDIVSRMTGGRYAKVELDENYDILMFDRGVAYPIQRFSGGEQAVVNLALRLALSQMIGVQTGTEGLGFIILDEVFGSADAERRETIMETLGGLRNIYSQIIVISHIDAVVDMLPNVVTVEVDGTVSKITG